MKKMLSILAVLLVAFSLNAQSNLKFGVGPTVGLPMGTFGDVVTLGYGGLASGEMSIGDGIVGTLTTGYMMFSGKDVSGFKLGNWTAIPILLGAKYSFADQFYGMVQLGLNMVTFETPSITFLGTTIGGVSVSESKLGYGFGVGMDLGQFDVNVKYATLATDAAFIGLTAMYKFSL
jgi:hypothetical protein